MDYQLLSFFVVAFVITITPGADTMMVIRNTLRGGHRDGWITAAGICSGLLVHASFSALGLSLILTSSATAFTVVKLVGAAYLMYLGVQSIRNAKKSAAASQQTRDGGKASPRRSFTEGFLSNVLNPKVAIFYLAFLPQFIRPGDPVLVRSLLLALIHGTQGMLWLGAIAVALERGAHLTGERFKIWTSRISGGVLAALGLRLAFERR